MIATSSGTLIVAIPCKDGLVLSADKKEVIKAPDGYAITRYDAVKIRRLGRFAAFGATGSPIMYNIIDRSYDSVEPIYDAREAVELFYSGTEGGRAILPNLLQCSLAPSAMILLKVGFMFRFLRS